MFLGDIRNFSERRGARCRGAFPLEHTHCRLARFRECSAHPVIYPRASKRGGATATVKQEMPVKQEQPVRVKLEQPAAMPVMPALVKQEQPPRLPAASEVPTTPKRTRSESAPLSAVSPAQPKQKKAKKTTVRVGPSVRGVRLTGQKVESLLLNGEPFHPFGQELLAYPQVMRLCCRTARLHFEHAWPQHVAVLLAGAEERGRALVWQWEASHLMGIVYSADHWALAAIARSPPKAVFYDGLPGKTAKQRAETAQCMERAVALVAHLVEVGWLQTQPTLVRADVPVQGDGWSCGHRVGLLVDFVLGEVSAAKSLPEEVPSEILSQSSIDLLIQRAQASSSSRQGKNSPAPTPKVPGSQSAQPPAGVVSALCRFLQLQARPAHRDGWSIVRMAAEVACPKQRVRKGVRRPSRLPRVQSL